MMQKFCPPYLPSGDFSIKKYSQGMKKTMGYFPGTLRDTVFPESRCQPVLWDMGYLWQQVWRMQGRLIKNHTGCMHFCLTVSVMKVPRGKRHCLPGITGWTILL